VNVVWQLAAAVAAAVHVLFFCLESLLFSRPAVYRRFLLSTAEEARVVRPMAFNQGFYNLFLAAGAAGGIVANAAGEATVGRTLVGFSCGCMVLAAVVLLVTDRRFVRAALVQAVPALVALVAVALST
jgi:putative membrane protein